MKRLSLRTAPPLGYDRAAVRPGVVHLGLGAFHRAHQAPVFDAVLRAGDLRWGIAGIAMRSPRVVDALAPQDGLYSLTERDAGPIAPRIVGAIVETAVAARNEDRIRALLAAASTHLVTLTVTEKGYAVPCGGVAATAPGLLARGLADRYRAGRAPLTIISCDNLARNGDATRIAVVTAAQRLGLPDAAIASIDRETAFPSTMVDRITPATTDRMARDTATVSTLEDAAPVWTEPFWQWVIEDRFANARPDLTAHGVQLVADVEPWQKAKLRLLNAAHSALAYAGLTAGYAYIHEAIADPGLHGLVEDVWREAASTLDGGTIDIPGYLAALRRRFANAALPHALLQIAADGSQKVGPRLIATLEDRRPSSSPAIGRAVMKWIDALASDLPLSDPLIATLRPLACAGDVATILAAIGMDAGVAAAVLRHGTGPDATG